MSRPRIRLTVDGAPRRRPISTLALASVVAAALAAGASPPTSPRAAVASRLAGISGDGSSSIQVANLSQTEPMKAQVQFFKQGGGAPVAISLPSVPPLSMANAYLPTIRELTDGAYTAIVTTDQPSAAVARTDWIASGAAILGDAPQAGTSVMAPLVVSGFGGQTSIVNIQNLDTANDSEVAIAVRGQGSATILADTMVSVRPGTSVSLDLAAHPAFAALPGGFAGSLVATAATPIAVQVINDAQTSARAVYDYNGAATGASSLFVPRFRSADASVLPGQIIGGARDTWIAVGNVSAAAVDVTVRYAGMEGACAGQSTTHGGRAFAIPAGASLIFSQGADGQELPAGPSGLPAGCAGAARIDAAGSGQPAIVAAVVELDRTLPHPGRTVTAGGYSAFRADEAATLIQLPLYRSVQTASRLATDVTVMNPGPEAATARLRLIDASGSETDICGLAPCETVLPAGAAYTWRPESTHFGVGRYGVARIRSDQPVVAILTDESRARSNDTALVRGLGVPAVGSGPWSSALPILMLDHAVVAPRSPTPPAPTPTVAPTAAPKVTLHLPLAETLRR